MTSSCVSPARYHGLPWESWTNSLGRTSPMEDKPPEPNLKERNKAGVMKLPKEDMKIFGLCPERDQFTVVVCETCNICVKPEALLHHFDIRHSNNNVHQKQPTVKELPVQEKTPVTAKAVKSANTIKNMPSKVKTKRSSCKETNKGKAAIMNHTPSLPVSLTLGATISPRSSKGEPLQPVVALRPVPGAPVKPAAPVQKPGSIRTPPMPTKTRRPPRKPAPTREREYDPDKHCGVVSAETMKPCTCSLTCKAHQMSLRRAVKGRSKPFDRLLADHRQAKDTLVKQKETIQKQKKNVELRNSSVIVIPPSSQPNREKKVTFNEKQTLIKPVKKLLPRPPDFRLDITVNKRVYLSSCPKSLLIKSTSRPPPPHPTLLHAYSRFPGHNVLAFTHSHPRQLSVQPMFSKYKVGGLLYLNRSMKIFRNAMEACINRSKNSFFIQPQRRDDVMLQPVYNIPSTLTSVFHCMHARTALIKSRNTKRNKSEKSNKPNKKVCLPTKETTNVLNVQVSKVKTILSRQYPLVNSVSVQSTTNTQFHILNSALKRSASTPPKTQNKKLKKKNPTTLSSVLTAHSKNSLVPNKPTVSYIPNKSTAPYVPNKSTAPCVPNKSTAPHVRNRTIVPNVQNRFAIPFLPNKSTVSFVPNKFSAPNSPNKFAAPHPPNKFAAPHPPNKFAVPHPPNKFTAPHPPNKLTAPHPPNKSTVPYVPYRLTVPYVSNKPAVPYVPNKPTVPLVPNKPNIPYVRVGHTNRIVEPHNRNISMCEPPKFSSSNRMLSENDIRKVGLRFEIFD